MAQSIYQPGPDDGLDGHMEAVGHIFAYGLQEVIWFGIYSFIFQTINRSLATFDISDIAAGSVFDNASKLELDVFQAAEAAGGDFKLHRLTRTDVVEAEFTWDEYKSGSSWTSPGGDYDAPEVAFTGPGVNETGWLTITGASLAAFLQDALDDRAGIVRFLGKRVTEVGTDRWHCRSSEYEDDTSKRPKLTAVYTPPTVDPFLRPGKYLY